MYLNKVMFAGFSEEQHRLSDHQVRLCPPLRHRERHSDLPEQDQRGHNLCHGPARPQQWHHRGQQAGPGPLCLHGRGDRHPLHPEHSQ